jgi:hypothetical protein
MSLPSESRAALPGEKPPFHPRLVLAIAIALPGVGQLFNNQTTRAFLFAFSIASLGWVSYHLTTPEHSFLGRYAGGLFVYAISILDAYRTAKWRWEIWWHERRRAEGAIPPAEAVSPPKG